MPEFALTVDVDAPLEDVWKLLYDPTRFPEWFFGMQTVRTGDGAGDDFTYWLADYPDFPMPQRLRTDHADRRVTISCLVSFLEFSWQLEELPTERTRVALEVTIPEQEAHRLEDQRGYAERSMSRLAAVAEAQSTAGGSAPSR
ncbi:SRPBCC family protein [Angustibacter luteus]|uniref:SRPBCC family protein n=1 Tax=Angustibacter luteus TaxID=658456 RepID=A0ABW1JDT9_9ACTN